MMSAGAPKVTISWSEQQSACFGGLRWLRHARAEELMRLKLLDDPSLKECVCACTSHKLLSISQVVFRNCFHSYQLLTDEGG